MATAREDDAASKRKEEEGSSADQAEHRKADETMARSAAAADQETVARTAADIDEYPDDDEDYDDDPIIRSLNLISKRNLMPAEWIEHRRKQHYEHHALINSVYDALQKGEIESDSDDDGAAAAEWTKRLWAGVDLSGINTADGENAVAVYPAGVYPPESRPEKEKEEDEHEAASAEDTNK